jgi:hypothetical protein
VKIPTIKHSYTDENGRTVAVLDGTWKSEKEIEEASRAYMDLLSSRIKPEDWTASNEIAFHKSATFMDYLHGDVKDEEAESACHYEYARESWQMWKAFKVRKEARANGKLNYENDFWQNVFYEAEVEEWIRATTWATELLMCESFPDKDWNELSKPERKKIMFMFYARRKVEPLPLQILHYFHYPKEKFPEFNELAAQNKPVMKNVRPGETQVPVKLTKAMTLKSGSVYHCLFTVDFSESKNLLHDRFVAWLNQDMIEERWEGHKKQRKDKNRNALRSTKIVPPKGEWRASTYWCLFEVDLSARKGDLTDQFDKWLASPKIKKLLKRYKQEKRGTSDKWKDRLKDLAAWRLCREITKEPKAWIWANEYACKHRKDNRQFHNAKAQRPNGKIIPANQARLFGDPSEASDAVRNALDLLAEWIPSDEFKEPSPSMKSLLAAFE